MIIIITSLEHLWTRLISHDFITGLLNEVHQNCENAVITTSEPDAANDELLSRGTPESTISVLPSLTGIRGPLPALERAATSLQINSIYSSFIALEI